MGVAYFHQLHFQLQQKQGEEEEVEAEVKLAQFSELHFLSKKKQL